MTVEVPEAIDPEPFVHRATGLLRELPLEEGDRLLTVLEDGPEAFAVGLACQLAGIVQVPLHHDLPAREIAEIVTDADPAVVLASPASAAGGLPGSVRVEVLTAERWQATTPAEPAARWPRTRPMAYTSGTTGRRKGVWVGIHDPSWGEAVVRDEHRTFDQRHGDTHLVVSPLHHSGPFRFAFVTAYLGGRVAVLPRFDAETWLQALRQIRPTSLFCVPTHLRRLLALDDLRSDDLASLKLIAHAGAPCPVPLKERLLDVAPDGSVWEFYGSTEGQFTVCPPDVWREAPGSVGHARPGHELEIRDDDGQPVPRGQVGTVWTHAPAHARWEYWRDPQRTAQAWDDGWFTVGDLGRLDDAGRLVLAGRPGDLVISGGVNVYPAEVERRLLEHPDVAEAVVFGLEDEEWGERVVAAVVPRADAAPTEQDLRDHARDGLQTAKVPKRILIVDDLPRTSTGKTRRVDLARAFDLA